MKSAEELALRRLQLRLRAAEQRAELGAALEPALRVVRGLDRAVAAARWIGERPQVVLGATVAMAALGALFVFSKPARMLRLARLGLSVWQAWRWVRILLVPLRAHRNL